MNYYKGHHIHKNPHLVTEKIDENFYAVYNPFINNGLKVLNINQYETLVIFCCCSVSDHTAGEC